MYRPQGKVISVGNITMGGAGKTPMVILLAREIQKRQRHPVVVTRGYMARKGTESDEVHMIQEILPGIAVYAGADRVSLIKRVEEDGLGRVLLLDDGFQHWRIARDLDIIVLDAMCAFGNNHLLPRGILREPISSLARADVIVLARADIGRAHIASLRQRCGQINPKALIVESGVFPLGVTNLRSGKGREDPVAIRGDVGMMCAIGSPDNFRESLENLGARIQGSFIFRDHHSYTADDLKGVIQECRSQGIRKLVTTHKDAVKMREFIGLFEGIDVFVLDVEVRITHGEDEFFSRIDRLLHS